MEFLLALLLVSFIANIVFLTISFSNKMHLNHKIEELGTEIITLNKCLKKSQTNEQKLSTQIEGLNKTIEEKQKYLENCWKKIEELEPPKKIETTRASYGQYGCNACNRPIDYCICFR